LRSLFFYIASSASTVEKESGRNEKSYVVYHTGSFIYGCTKSEFVDEAISNLPGIYELLTSHPMTNKLGMPNKTWVKTGSISQFGGIEA